MTSLLQSMDQGAIAILNTYILSRRFAQAIRAIDGDNGVTLNVFWAGLNIHKATDNTAELWNEVVSSNMNDTSKLLPDYINECQGFMR